MSHIRIKNEYYRTPEFIRFNKAIKSTVFFFLLSAVIRESAEVKMVTHGAHYIYNAHYLKGELVSRYSQEKIAEYLGTSQPRVSKYIAELEQDGLIKVIKRKTRKGSISYYQVGEWTGKIGNESYKETLWFDTIFTWYYEDFRKKKADRRKQEAEESIMETLGIEKGTIEHDMMMMGY